jgi:ribosomal protein L11 methylase PrmA
LLSHQADDVIQRYNEWFVMDTPKQQEDWVIISGTRR